MAMAAVEAEEEEAEAEAEAELLTGMECEGVENGEDEEVAVNDAEADRGDVGVEKQKAPSAAMSMATAAAAASRWLRSAPLVSARARSCFEWASVGGILLFAVGDMPIRALILS